MKRILGYSLLTLAMIVPALAQTTTNALTNVFYISADGDCTNDPCSAATARKLMCRPSGSSLTIYACDTSTGFFAAVASGGGGTPGGSDQQIQLNNAGAFGGASRFSYSTSTNAATMAHTDTYTALILDNTDETADEHSPRIEFRNSTSAANDQSMFLRVNSSGALEVLEDLGIASRFTIANAGGVTMAGSTTMSTAGATVDGKDLDYVLANAKVIEICASGGKYTTLGAALTAETSTAANPIVYRLCPGTYTGRITFSGEDHFAIVGAGEGVTTLQFDTTSALAGVLEPGTSTNGTIANLTIKGKIYWDGGTTGGGEVRVHNVQFLTSDALGDNDCMFVDRFAAGSKLYYHDNTCLTTTDGLTCGRDCANVDFYIQGKFGPLFASSANNQTMKMVRFNSTPCFVYDAGSTINLTAARTGGAMYLIGYSFEGTEATGNCAGTGRAYFNGTQSFIHNTTSNQAGSGTAFISVQSGADELDEIRLVGVTSVTQASDADDTAVFNVDIDTANTVVTVHGGHYRATGGTDNRDFDTLGTGTIQLYGVDYGNSDALDGGTINGTFKGFSVDTFNANFFYPARINYISTLDADEGVILDSLDDGARNDTSPHLVLRDSTAGAGDDQWSLRTNDNGNFQILDDANVVVIDGRQAYNTWDVYLGGFHLLRPGAELLVGDGSGNNGNRIRFYATNEGDLQWNSTNKRFEFIGAELGQITGATTAATVGTAGDFTVDTSASQWVYGGAAGAVKVLDPVRDKCAVITDLAAADDNFEFWMTNQAVTITSVGCRCRGTCTGTATLTLEDRAGNAMTITGTNPTCATTGNATYAAVTAGNGLVAGEGIAFDVTNTPNPETDEYTICVTYTTDRQ